MEPERTPLNDEIYRQIRSEMQFEFSLINARVNWLIASQAFLLAPLVIGAGGRSLAQSQLYPLVPLLGLAICLLVLLAISGAVWRSLQWRAKASQGAYRGCGEHGRFSIIAPHSPWIPWLGLAGTAGVPATLIAAWLWLLLWPPAPT